MRCTRRRLSLALLASTVGGCGGGDGGARDLLAFVADGRSSGTFEVFVGYPGGTPVPVSGPFVDGSWAGELGWSPDRDRLAFLSDRDDPAGADLFVVDVRTGERDNLTAMVDDPVLDYVWSPTGSHVAVVTLTSGNIREIRAIPMDGGAPVLLTLQLGGIVDGQALALAWRPQGPGDPASLAYRGDPEVPFRRDLYLVNADGTGHVRLNERGGGVSESASVSRFDWAPDGSRLAYTYDPIPGADRLFVTEGGPSAERSGLGAAAGRSVETYAWAPDASRLAWIANGGVVDAADVYVAPATGGPPAPLTSHGSGAYASWISWSPDATRLAHASFTGNAAADNYALHLHTFAGASDVVLHPHSALGTVWSPAGDRLVFAADAFAPGNAAESLRVWISDLTNPAVDAIGDLPVDGAVDAYGTFWDPTGERILFFLSPAVGNDGLQTALASGAPRASVGDPSETISGSSNGGRAWSPSGTFVAYRPELPGDGGLRPLRARNVRTGALVDFLETLPGGTVSREFAWR